MNKLIISFAFYFQIPSASSSPVRLISLSPFTTIVTIIVLIVLITLPIALITLTIDSLILINHHSHSHLTTIIIVIHSIIAINSLCPYFFSTNSTFSSHSPHSYSPSLSSTHLLILIHSLSFPTSYLSKNLSYSILSPVTHS